MQANSDEVSGGISTSGSFSDRFGIPTYQSAALTKLTSEISLQGKKVLEVGGSNLPRELTHELLGADEWVCIDVLNTGFYQVRDNLSHYEKEGIHQFDDADKLIGTRDYLIFDGPIEGATFLPNDYYDVVLSITSFEHIIKFRSALSQIMRSKKRQGKMFSYHGPIWSSFCGHHMWVNEDLNFNVRDCIPAYSHLLLTPPEMFNYIEMKFGFANAEEAVHQIYHSPRINRLMFEDYSSYIMDSGLQLESLEAYGVEPLDSRLLAKLVSRFPGRQRFDAYGVCVFAK